MRTLTVTTPQNSPLGVWLGSMTYSGSDRHTPEQVAEAFRILGGTAMVDE